MFDLENVLRKEKIHNRSSRIEKGKKKETGAAQHTSLTLRRYFYSKEIKQ
jgi:hypothetical protein